MTAIKNGGGAKRRQAAKRKGAGRAKQEGQKQPEKEAVTSAAGAEPAQGTDQHPNQAFAVADVQADANSATGGHAGPDDGYGGAKAPEGETRPEETGDAGNADAGEPAKGRSDDNAASDAAGTADVSAAADLDAVDAASVVPGVTGEPRSASPASHDTNALSYSLIAGMEPEPLTDDMPLWAGFRAQRAVARALADDQDAPCLSFRQCGLVADLLAKSPDASMGALEMQLKLKGQPLRLKPPLGAALLDAFRGAWRTVARYLDLKQQMETPPAEPRPVTIAEKDRALKLTPEPFALSETAKGR